MDRIVLEYAARINLALERIDDALKQGEGNTGYEAEEWQSGSAEPSESMPADARDAIILRLQAQTAELKAELMRAENDLRQSKMEISGLMAICERCNTEKVELQKSAKLKEDAFIAEKMAIKLERTAELQQLDSILETLKPLLEENLDA